MASSICDGRSVLVAALVVLMGAWPAPLRAQAGDESATKRQAEAKLQEGVTLLKERRYAEALARFQEAHALVPSPLILYDFGQAQLGLGDDPRALESFEDFLAGAPDAPEAKRRRAAQYRDDLRTRVAVVTVNADVTGASVTLDGHDVGRVDLPRRFYLTPGAHELIAHTDRVTQSATLTCVAGQPQTVSMALAAPPAAPAAPVVPIASGRPEAAERLALSPPAASVTRQSGPADMQAPSPSHARSGQVQFWALTAAAAGAAALGAGLTFGVLAGNQADRVTADSQSGRDFVPADEASGLRDQRLEIVFLSAGTVALLAGLGIYAFMRHRDSSHGAARGAP